MRAHHRISKGAPCALLPRLIATQNYYGNKPLYYGTIISTPDYPSFAMATPTIFAGECEKSNGIEALFPGPILRHPYESLPCAHCWIPRIAWLNKQLDLQNLKRDALRYSPEQVSRIPYPKYSDRWDTYTKMNS